MAILATQATAELAGRLQRDTNTRDTSMFMSKVQIIMYKMMPCHPRLKQTEGENSMSA